VKRELPGGLELDDDGDRIDVDAVHDYIANHSYWAPGRPRALQEELIRQAIRVVGLYDGERQIGFARAIATRISSTSPTSTSSRSTAGAASASSSSAR
jgi:hypothetical protein